MSFFRKFFPKRSPVFKAAIPFCKTKHGLEIGGPSFFLSNGWHCPIYSIVGTLDGCNFSEKSVWVGEVKAGKTYVYDQNKAPGTLYICEGHELSTIPDASYDFVLSSHNLEHFANPIKALRAWQRVIKTDGVCLVIVPQKELIFDKHRDFSSFEHMLVDFQNDVKEGDLGHLDEIVEKTDMPTYPVSLAKTREELMILSQNNFTNRCMHHHVFNEQTMKKLAGFCGFSILKYAQEKPYNLSFLLKKKH